MLPSGSMERPLVSIVLPTYRRPTYLERAIASVLVQSYPDWDLIIVDDNDDRSDDRRRTEASARVHMRDERVRLIGHDRNRGGSAARNTGARHAAGEYIAFLDDDDEWLPTKLERQLETFRAGTNDAAAVFTAFVHVSHEGEGERLQIPRILEPLVPILLCYNAIGPTSIMMVRRDALSSVGGFDETLPAKQDVDLYVRLAEAYRFDVVLEPLVRFHRHGDASIGKDSRAAVEAQRAFARKHAARIDASDSVRKHRLIEGARVLLAAGQMRAARRDLIDAMRIHLMDTDAALLLAASYLGPLTRWFSRRRVASRVARSGARSAG